ncbi:MAG: non-canonical purine NTP pyrophosphatase, partial [Flavobacteriales bacterium]
IYSARYSGVKDDDTNLQFLLKNLTGEINRKARFKTVISLLKDGKNHLFEGVIEGTIRTSPTGTNGFGYDPIFQPNGYDITFAEMNMEEKNKISHRALAMQKLIEFLKK